MAFSDSVTPFTLPGRFNISVLCRIPDRARDNAASGVDFLPSLRMSSGKPGISLSMMATVASGVTSRGPNPVPPTVKARSMSSIWQTWRSLARICSNSSGTISILTTSSPNFLNAPRAAGPDKSLRSPREAESLTVMMIARGLRDNSEFLQVG
jgi:hypothetical protein